MGNRCKVEKTLRSVSKFDLDCFAVEQAIFYLGENYSLKDLSFMTGLSSSRCYKCWISLLKKKKIKRGNTLTIIKKQSKVKKVI